MRTISKTWISIVYALTMAGTATVVASGDEENGKEVLRQKDIFISEEGAYYRIPNLVATTDGTLIAFAARRSEGPNQGTREVVFRRSEDEGRNWEPIQKIGNGTMGAAIVDTTSGHVLVWVGTSLWRSEDNGESWSRERPEVGENSLGGAGRTHGSESGITLEHGEHAGRLLMPARINLSEDHDDHFNCAIYSDDGGRSWMTSEPVQPGTGEGTLAELSDGTIYYNSRSHAAMDNMRRIAWSYDGGETFTDFSVEENLYEPGYGRGYGCNAGLLRLPLDETDGNDVILFSNPDSKGGERVRMTVRASLDSGQSWPLERLVYEGPSAYSSLAPGRNGKVHLLYERGEDHRYDGMAVATFNLSWLARGEDWKQHLDD